MTKGEMTGREMCEYVSRWFKEKHGKDVSPDDIWHASPTGELAHVFTLYYQARKEMGDPMPEPCDGCGSLVIGEHHLPDCTGCGAHMPAGG